VIALLAVFRLAAGLALAAPTPTPRPHAPGPAAAPATHVEAENIEYQYKQRRTVMTGNPVVFTRDDARLVCRKLTADNDEGGEIRHAVCEGDVKLTRGEKAVTCARATYDSAGGTVVCRGDPILRDGASIVHCDEVVYHLDEDKVTVTKAKGTLVQRPGQPLPVPAGKAR
jgi:lipopolysaccharide transport protein LptA